MNFKAESTDVIISCKTNVGLTRVEHGDNYFDEVYMVTLDNLREAVYFLFSVELHWPGHRL